VKKKEDLQYSDEEALRRMNVAAHERSATARSYIAAKASFGNEAR
jgi:hypothetical protein